MFWDFPLLSKISAALGKNSQFFAAFINYYAVVNKIRINLTNRSAVYKRHRLCNI